LDCLVVYQPSLLAPYCLYSIYAVNNAEKKTLYTHRWSIPVACVIQLYYTYHGLYRPDEAIHTPSPGTSLLSSASCGSLLLHHLLHHHLLFHHLLLHHLLHLYSTLLLHLLLHHHLLFHHLLLHYLLHLYSTLLLHHLLLLCSTLLLHHLLLLYSTLLLHHLLLTTYSTCTLLYSTSPTP
ncbi:hypothetical protein AALO_G00155330, partial [Alosa alosa]